MRSSTSRSWSRNHSAMRVAVNAARRRTQRGLVGGGHDHHRAGEALGTEVVLDELADLTAALTDEREHGDRRFGAARDHGEQGRLPDAGSREDAHALPAPARHQRVDRAHAERELGVDHAARERMRCAGAPRRRAGRGAAAGRRRSGGRGRRARGRAARGRPGSTPRRRRRGRGRPSARRAGRRAACTRARRRGSRRLRRSRDRWSVSTATELPIGRCRPMTLEVEPEDARDAAGHVGPGGVEHGVEQRGHAGPSLPRRSGRAPRAHAVERGVEAGVDAAAVRRRRCSRRVACRRRRRARATGRARGRPGRRARRGLRGAGGRSRGPARVRSRARAAIASRPACSVCVSSWPTSTCAISNATATTWSSMSTRAVASRAYSVAGGVAELRHEARSAGRRGRRCARALRRCRRRSRSRSRPRSRRGDRHGARPPPARARPRACGRRAPTPARGRPARHGDVAQHARLSCGR